MISQGLQSLIESIVEAALEEAAISVPAMTRQKLALMITGDNNRKAITLWNPEAYYRLMKDIGDPSKLDSLDVIVGCIRVKSVPSCGYWQVETSAANKGYGPSMYDIAMGQIYPEGLTSDRFTVSQEAQNVWNYMLTHRAHEIERIPAREDCRMPGAKPEDARNFIYTMKAHVQPEISQLTANHEQAIDYAQDPDWTLQHITQLSNKFFSRKT